MNTCRRCTGGYDPARHFPDNPFAVLGMYCGGCVYFFALCREGKQRNDNGQFVKPEIPHTRARPSTNTLRCGCCGAADPVHRFGETPFGKGYYNECEKCGAVLDFEAA